MKKRVLALLLTGTLLAQSGLALAAEIDIGDISDEITEEIVVTEDPVDESAPDVAAEETESNENEAEETVQAITVNDTDTIDKGECGDNLKWTLDSEGTLTISGTGAMTDWTGFSLAPWNSNADMIKNVSIGDGVTSIGDSAFSNCSNLTSVTIPNSVKSIGKYAFDYCSNLTSVTIPNGVTSIGDYAFYSCSNLTSVTIPNSVKSIGDSAFSNCSNLTSVTIPNSVKSIGERAFYGCSKLTSMTIPTSVTSIGVEAFYSCSNLMSVTIPNSVTSIGISAFGYCASLTTINVDSGNTTYSSQNGVLYNKTKSALIQYPTGSSRTSFTIPNGVTSIGEYAFYSCSSLTSVTIPNSVKSIGDGAFAWCGLTSITIPNSVTSIGASAFRGCGLTSITIPGSVTSIGGEAFGYCSNLTSVTIGNGVTSIGDGAFFGCEKLKDVYYLGTAAEWKAVSIEMGNSCLTSATLHTHTHSYKTTTTKAKPGANGKTVRKCSVCGKVSTTTIYAPKTLTLSATSYTYNGKTKKPTVKVKDSKGNTISSTHYTVSYASGRKYVGKYKVTVKFKSTSSKYSGTLSTYFKINPKGTTLKTPTAGSKSFTAKWTKQSTQTSGYQLQYSTSSKFTNAKTVTISGNKTTSKKITKLTAKKKYYVRIRTYKTVSGTKYYSAWSSAKTVTTKK